MLRELQDKSDFTRVLAISEELKTFPFGEVWDEYCERCGAPVGADWLREVELYEAEVLSKRI
jgi:L-rhamnose isomerase